jgi:mono/diheme cytochrome c family protein
MFPFIQRWLLRGWKLLNFTPRRFEPDPGRSPEWNRGAYLVEALEHCGTCHTPPNLTFGVNRGRAFAGGDVGAWQAYNISSDPVSGIGLWNDAELLSYLATGKAPGKGYAAGPMAEAVEKSLQHLSNPDLSAILTYLRSLRPIRLRGDSKPRFDHGRPAQDEMSLRGIAGVTLSARPVSSAELFSGQCANCHGADGKGSADGYYPSRFHDTVLGAPSPNNLILVLLEGVQRQGPHEASYMPAFAGLTNQGIAELVNYAESRFGDPHVRVTAKVIDTFRTSEVLTVTPDAGNRAHSCLDHHSRAHVGSAPALPRPQRLSRTAQ